MLLECASFTLALGFGGVGDDSMSQVCTYSNSDSTGIAIVCTANLFIQVIDTLADADATPPIVEEADRGLASLQVPHKFAFG